MFEFVPILNGYYFTYNQYLLILTICGINFLALVFFCLSKLFYFLSRTNKMSKQAKKSYANLDLDPTLSTASTDVTSRLDTGL